MIITTMIDSNSRFTYHNNYYFLFCQPRWFKMLTGRGDPSLAIDLIVYVEVLDIFIGTRPFHKNQTLEIHIAAFLFWVMRPNRN